MILINWKLNSYVCTLSCESAKAITKQMPVPVQEVTAKVDEYARGMISGSGSTLFEELGWVFRFGWMFFNSPVYQGTILPIPLAWQALLHWNCWRAQSPRLGCHSPGGENYKKRWTCLDPYSHGERSWILLCRSCTGQISRRLNIWRSFGVGFFTKCSLEAWSFNSLVNMLSILWPFLSKQKKSAGGLPTYTQIFADALIGEAGHDESVVAVHAAMGGGTGLNHFEKFFAVCVSCVHFVVSVNFFSNLILFVVAILFGSDFWCWHSWTTRSNICGRSSSRGTQTDVHYLFDIFAKRIRPGFFSP